MASILVAEDDRSVREFVTRALQHRGHQVVGVEDGLQALDVLQNRDFDLLVTDIVMPEMDGIALALKLAKEKPQLRILLMSGYSIERQRAHNLQELIHTVLPKPFTLVEICEAVDSALSKPI